MLNFIFFIFIIIIFILLLGVAFIGKILSSLFHLFSHQNPYKNNKNDKTTDNASKKKIFEKNEGEYIDFEEIKDNNIKEK